MSCKKKPSGAEFRKKRKLNEALYKKQTIVANKLFNKINPNGCDISRADVRETDTENESNVSLSDGQVIFIVEDPGTWPAKMNNKLIEFLIENGPTQVTIFNFPTTNKRKFNVSAYKKMVPNGDLVERSWLMYSIAKDAVFCFCCKLFENKNSLTFSDRGFKDWSHLQVRIKQHEQSPVHVENFKTWKSLYLRLKGNAIVDASVQIQMEKEIYHWNDVLRRLLILVQFLGTQNLTFRGVSNVLHTQNNGNFLKLVEAISKFDLVLADHLKRITDETTHTTNLSSNIQNELIDIIAKSVQNKIIKMVKESKYYSVVVDSTPDVNRVHQQTLVVRFVHKQNNTFEIREHFLGYLETNDKSEFGIPESVLKLLNQLDLSISNCRGQGYDYNSNKKVIKQSAMQNRISVLEPRAFYVPCASHTLNSIVNECAVDCSLIAVNFFDTVQCLFVFLSSSTNRWDILKNHVKELTVKPLSGSAWQSRIDALKLLISDLENIYEALVDISDNGDSVTKATANSLGNKILDFKFICCLVIWNDILTKINIASKYLENKSVNITTACSLIQSSLLCLEELRSDEKFNEFICIAENKAHSLDIPTHFPIASILRSRHIKHESQNEEICNPETLFQTEFYYKILDEAIKLVRERFEQLEVHNNSFSFLYDIGTLDNVAELNIFCKKLSNTLSNGIKLDVCSEELYNELTSLCPLIKPKTSGIEVLQYIHTNNLEELFPNSIIAIKILLTLPITVAPGGGDLSFSKLKLIKNYLTSTMGQEEGCANLSFVSIESQLVETLACEELINDLSKLKAQQINYK